MSDDNNNKETPAIPSKNESDAAAPKSTKKKGCCGNNDKHLASLKCCPKHLQLPMFLSKTYHMIEKCEGHIATWSDTGDNFVVKNVDLFAKNILPMYFKHSNFSSFARQLNFYGFRKLRMDPILTSDVDPCTACHVRFFHEHFQRGKPELLQNIKRATKGDQQSNKDDLDSLRQEVSKLKDCLRNTSAEYDRKLAELSYECNRRITSMNAEYDKLAALVHSALGLPSGGAAASGSSLLATLASSTTTASATLGSAAAAAGLSSLLGAGSASQIGQLAARADLLHSLSQAAVSIGDAGIKRSAEDDHGDGGGDRKRRASGGD